MNRIVAFKYLSGQVYRMGMEKWGRMAFYIGVVIAVAAGAVYGTSSSPAIVGGLIVLGIIVGLLNVTGSEVGRFLLATVALLLVGDAVGSLPFGDLTSLMAGIFDHFVAFVAGAALIVGFKEVWAITKSK